MTEVKRDVDNACIPWIRVRSLFSQRAFELHACHPVLEIVAGKLLKSGEVEQIKMICGFPVVDQDRTLRMEQAGDRGKRAFEELVEAGGLIERSRQMRRKPVARFRRVPVQRNTGTHHLPAIAFRIAPAAASARISTSCLPSLSVFSAGATGMLLIDALFAATR